MPAPNSYPPFRAAAAYVRRQREGLGDLLLAAKSVEDVEYALTTLSVSESLKTVLRKLMEQPSLSPDQALDQLSELFVALGTMPSAPDGKMWQSSMGVSWKLAPERTNSRNQRRTLPFGAVYHAGGIQVLGYYGDPGDALDTEEEGLSVEDVLVSYAVNGYGAAVKTAMVIGDRGASIALTFVESLTSGHKIL